MNDIANFRTAVETLQSIESWSAWSLRKHESDAIALHGPETLDEALTQALGTLCWHSGDILGVQHSHDGRGEHTLWQFKVTQSTRNGTWRESTNGGRRVFVGRPEPKLICQTALAVPFSPKLRFDAFRDGASGRDLQLVELG